MNVQPPADKMMRGEMVDEFTETVVKQELPEEIREDLAGFADGIETLKEETFDFSGMEQCLNKSTLEVQQNVYESDKYVMKVEHDGRDSHEFIKMRTTQKKADMMVQLPSNQLITGKVIEELTETVVKQELQRKTCEDLAGFANEIKTLKEETVHLCGSEQCLNKSIFEVQENEYESHNYAKKVEQDRGDSRHDFIEMRIAENEANRIVQLPSDQLITEEFTENVVKQELQRKTHEDLAGFADDFKTLKLETIDFYGTVKVDQDGCNSREEFNNVRTMKKQADTTNEYEESPVCCKEEEIDIKYEDTGDLQERPMKDLKENSQDIVIFEEDANRGAEKLTEEITKKCEKYFTKRKHPKQLHPPKYWWTTDIAEKRKARIKCRRTLTRLRKTNRVNEIEKANSEYKNATRELRKAIMTSKSQCWKDLGIDLNEDM